jgi:hypothetical protein
MTDVFLGVLFILGGFACAAIIVIFELANPTPGQYNGPDRRPAAWLSLALIACGVSFFIWG